MPRRFAASHTTNAPPNSPPPEGVAGALDMRSVVMSSAFVLAVCACCVACDQLRVFLVTPRAPSSQVWRRLGVAVCFCAPRQPQILTCSVLHAFACNFTDATFGFERCVKQFQPPPPPRPSSATLLVTFAPLAAPTRSNRLRQSVCLFAQYIWHDLAGADSALSALSRNARACA
jgi:hypothetical protein